MRLRYENKGRIKMMFQHDAMECGVACLQMVCSYYGMDYSLDELSEYCMPTKEGVSLYAISEAANALGLHNQAGYVTLPMLKTAPLPCILHWNQNHFVVLYKVSRKRYYIADPGKGKVCYTETEFAHSWLSLRSGNEEKGVGLFIQPTPLFYRKRKGLMAEKRSIRFVFGYFKQYRRYFGQIILGLFVASFIQLLFPFLTQAIVDIGIAYKDIDFIYLILLAQLMLVFSRTVINFIRNQLLLHISMRINISLVSDFFIKLLRLPMSFFDTKQLGDMMQRINDHNRVERFLTTEAINTVFHIFAFLIFGGVLWFYDSTVFVIFVLGSALYGIWICLFMNKRKQLDYEYFEKQAENNGKTYQFLTAMQEIKLQDCEQRRRWEWEDIQADMFNTNLRSLKLQQTQEVGSILINETKNIVITILAANAVINGSMSLGMMLAVQYMIGQLNTPIEQLMNVIYAMQDVGISLERINEIHNKEDEDAKNNIKQIEHADKGIRLQNICFKYNPHSPAYTLQDINMHIPAGKVTAIVGASGSGKTTLIKLLLGFYTPQLGHIYIGDMDLKKINKKWWRKQCGVVMQEGIVFSETIARNIGVDDRDIIVEQMVEAAHGACIDRFIKELPLKYDTVIGADGIELSKGQKQRILIARAIYKNPNYIFLDEATNALDASNEKEIVNNLDEFYNGKTVVIAAHRLSTVKNAHNIIVLDNGRIVETGDHETLIHKKGAYYMLVRNQLELGE